MQKCIEDLWVDFNPYPNAHNLMNMLILKMNYVAIYLLAKYLKYLTFI